MNGLAPEYLSDQFIKLNGHQYQHAKLETHSCLKNHYLKPQLAKEHFTIVWYLSGMLYLKILS